jgi:hypothetical protein
VQYRGLDKKILKTPVIAQYRSSGESIAQDSSDWYNQFRKFPFPARRFFASSHGRSTFLPRDEEARHLGEDLTNISVVVPLGLHSYSASKPRRTSTSEGTRRKRPFQRQKYAKPNELERTEK